MGRWSLLCGAVALVVLSVACAATNRPSGSAPAATTSAAAAGAASGGLAPAAAGSNAAPAAPAAASPPAMLPDKIKIAYTALSGSQLPMYVADESGLFARHGVDVEALYIASGTTGMASLVAGDIQFSVSTGPDAAGVHAGGAPAVLLMGWINTFPNLFMVEPSITSPAQLRGKPIGISRLGTQAHVSARLALKKWGIEPDEVQFIQLGGVPEILAGMQAGAVVGGAFSPPTNIRARQAGFHALGDLAQMGIPYQSTGLVALQPYVDANPEATRRVVRALLEGIKLVHTDDAASRAALGKVTQTDDVAVLDETIAYYRQITPRVPYPTLEGLQTGLDDLAETNPAARALRPQQLVNTTILEALEREGFIQQLYGDR
jgi:NitT/TauT family transport system substrate-binding protein